MSFKDLSIKKMYRTKKCNIVNEFFIPVLDNATSYKRAAGFFSSEGLYQLAEGIIGLVNNTGRIQRLPWRSRQRSPSKRSHVRHRARRNS